MGGFSGSGKSRLGRDLAPLLGGMAGAVILRTDVLRKRLMGADPETRLGEEGYSPEMSRRTYQELYDRSSLLLKAGLTVVADAVFAKEEQRQGIEAVAADLGIPFEGLWLEASPEVMKARIAKRKRNASDATAEVLERQLATGPGNINWLRLDSSASKEETYRNACKRLRLVSATP